MKSNQGKDQDKATPNKHDQASKFDYNVDRDTNQDVEKSINKDDVNQSQKK